MIRSGEARRVIVVAVESSLHPLFLASFRRLGVLPPDGVGCRPFDQHRAGFLMSEAAAAVILDAATSSDPSSHASNSPATRRIAVDQFAMGGDATHITATDPDGRVLRHLLKRAIDNRPIDLIHAHGTGTLLNDAMELAALESVLIDQTPPPALYSHKGALGHSLGAAGLLAVAINCECHRRNIIPPNPRTTAPLPTRKLYIPQHPLPRQITRSLITASGFGGPTAVVALATF